MWDMGVTYQGTKLLFPSRRESVNPIVRFPLRASNLILYVMQFFLTIVSYVHNFARSIRLGTIILGPYEKLR